MMFKGLLKKKSKNPSKYFESCSELPLINFCNIINSGDTIHLIKDEGCRDFEKETIIWGELMLEYSELDNQNEIKDRFNKLLTVNELKNAYNTIKAMIDFLMICTPTDKEYGQIALQYVESLKKMGYVISLKDSISYSDSLNLAYRKCNSLVTQIRMRQNEMQGDHEESNINYDDIMAMLQSHFNINEVVTVARYISMKKVIKSKNNTYANSNR